MEFSKLASAQHAFIEYLYKNLDVNGDRDLAMQFKMRDVDLIYLNGKGYIIAQNIGTVRLVYRIAPKGQSYYENYLAYLEEQKYQRDMDKATLEIAQEANEIARDANRKSKRANIIAVVSIAVSFVATLLAIVIPLLLTQ